MAYERELDLVEVAPNAHPPVCRLFDYSKYRYRLEKQERLQRAKGKSPQLKEIRFGLKIGEHDLLIKINRAKEFLQKGNPVRLTLQLRGREMMFKEKAFALLEKARDMAESEFEAPPTRLGNRFQVTLKKGHKHEAKNQ